MILLTVNDVRKHFGPDPVLDGVTFDVRPGDKISLVGPNGTGKTTLLRILAGRLEPDAGQVQLHSSSSVGFLEQQPKFDVDSTVWVEASNALQELRELSVESERLAHAIAESSVESERLRLGKRYDRLQQELHRRDAYQLDHKVERILEGLGFARDAFDQPVNQLSGGQQNRLLMAKLLLGAPDLMLLDEPSNHLDIDATKWLEDYLAASNNAVLVVSHDRYFLDKVTHRTLELFRGTVDSYPGNFSAYRRQKQERVEVQRKTYERQQAEIAKLEDFVRRHHHGQKHLQAEDRRKKLERIERVDPPREIAAPVMGFPAATRTGDVTLRIEHLSKRYDVTLFNDLTFDILRGEKWGILGPNGCGKTTLLRCLVAREKPDDGRVIFGANVKVGYFDQRLDDFDEQALAVDAVRPDHKEFVEQQRRDVLARFGVTGDLVNQRIASLSGGERNRTALARLAALDPNFLILDEPTNHLDLWSRNSLEESLREFDGTVIFVSHDRYFLNRVADHLLVVEPGRFRVIEGNYETFEHLARKGMVTEMRANSPASNTTQKPASNKRSDTSKPERRKRKFPYRKVADLEADIAEREQRIETIHSELASPDVLRDGNRVKRLKDELEQQQVSLARLYEHWEEAVELN